MPQEAYPSTSGTAASFSRPGPVQAEQADIPDSGVPGASSVTSAGGTVQPQPTPVLATLPDSFEDGLRVEVDLLQFLHIDDGQVLVFRRIVIGNQVFRQGKSPSLNSHWSAASPSPSFL